MYNQDIQMKNVSEISFIFTFYQKIFLGTSFSQRFSEKKELLFEQFGIHCIFYLFSQNSKIKNHSNTLEFLTSTAVNHITQLCSNQNVLVVGIVTCLKIPTHFLFSTLLNTTHLPFYQMLNWKVSKSQGFGSYLTVLKLSAWARMSSRNQGSDIQKKGKNLENP